MSKSRGVVLVTGGAGYIGSHACKALSRAGYSPVAFDNLCYGHDWAVKWGPLAVGDLQDGAALRTALQRYRPIAVMHFAAFAYVGESVADPAKYYRNNVSGTINLLDAMRSEGIDRLVFSSTCATYGVPKTMPITEATDQCPINPYGQSKLMIERILADYRAAYAMRAVSLRYFNAAGADPDGEIGEAHDPETHLIPLVLDVALGVRPNVSIFGDDYPTHDGTCVRDYIHVSDLADAHVRAIAALERPDTQPAYNLGAGVGLSVRSLVEGARRITGTKIPVVTTPRRAGDPPALVADVRLAQAELGWKTTMSSLDNILTTAWAWHRRHVVRRAEPTLQASARS